MNKTELVTAMMAETGMTKNDTEKALKAFINVTSGELAKGGKVQLIGFGTFEVADRAARNYFGKITPACKVPKFKAGKALKDMIK